LRTEFWTGGLYLEEEEEDDDEEAEDISSIVKA
jgi:hypothetical protein